MRRSCRQRLSIVSQHSEPARLPLVEEPQALTQARPVLVEVLRTNADKAMAGQPMARERAAAMRSNPGQLSDWSFSVGCRRTTVIPCTSTCLERIRARVVMTKGKRPRDIDPAFGSDGVPTSHKTCPIGLITLPSLTQDVKSVRGWGSVNTELSCPFNTPRLIWPSLTSHRPK